MRGLQVLTSLASRLPHLARMLWLLCALQEEELEEQKQSYTDAEETYQIQLEELMRRLTSSGATA
jgi:hypothetical protein